MRPEVWVHGAVLALAVAQFFVFWYLYRRSRLSSTHEAGASGAGISRDGSHEPADHHVTCPNCGSRNTGQFRYCQDCVEELPHRVRAG